ncbi:hypothetical protein, partial [Bilophila wadsworthia]|uniref:hypothetical protein n=1 Tax=Bilophila wadsworthia TaxID=35833 RepID=UPI0026DB40B5
LQRLSSLSNPSWRFRGKWGIRLCVYEKSPSGCFLKGSFVYGIRNGSLLSGKADIRVTATIICHYKSLRRMEVWFGEEEGPLLKKGIFLPKAGSPK